MIRIHTWCADLLVRLSSIALGLVLTACGTSSNRAPSDTLRDARITPPSAGLPSIPSIPEVSDSEPAPLKGEDHAVARPAVPLQTHRVQSGGVTLTLLTFDRRSHHLAVLDNAAGPGTGATTAQSAARATEGIAAINAGFFTPEGAPLGLVIENGKPLGALNRSSLGDGFYVHDPAAGSTALIRRRSWSTTTTPQHLLQSGPFLVERRTAVQGLSASPTRPRSFLLWDGHDGWAIGHARAASLAKLATSLAAQPVPGFTIESALNLDGGTSSDLWIASSVKGGPASTRQFWNKPVRNYLVLQRNQP